MSKKNVLTKTAIAAALAASAVVPVAAAPVAAAEVSVLQVVYTVDGQNLTLDFETFTKAINAGVLTDLDIQYVQAANGEYYTFEGFTKAVNAFDTLEEALEALEADESLVVDADSLDLAEGTVNPETGGVEGSVTVETDVLDAAVAAAGELEEADYTAESWAALQEALAFEVTAETTQEEVDAAVAAIEVAVDALVSVADLQVASVSAINTKTIEVTFNKAVEDTSKAVVAVKKGATTVGVAKTTWNEAKTVATLELNSKITEGTYTVTVTGLTTEALTGSVTAQNEKVAEIKFLSENLVLTTTTGDAATVGYQVLNQYGEDVTSNAVLSGTAVLNFTSSLGNAVSDGKGKVTISNLPTTTKAGDKIVLTAIHNSNAVTANTTLTVSATAQVTEVAVGEVYNKDGKVLSEDNLGTDSDAFYILVDAKDQYGNAITNAATANGQITVVPANTAIADKFAASPANNFEELTINNKKQLAYKIKGITAGDALFNFVANANGTVAPKTVTVAVGTKVDTVAFGQPSVVLTGGAKVEIPVEVYDNKGVAITTVSKLGNLKNTTTVTQAGTAINNANYNYIQKDGVLYLEVTLTGNTTSADQVLTILATTPTNKVANTTLTVKPNAVVTALVGLDQKVSTSILQGQTLTIDEKDFIVEDQYGNRITDVSKYSITADSKDGFTIDTTSEANKVKVTASATADTATLTFKLATTNSTIDTRFTAVKNSAFSSYKVENFGTVYATADSAYAKDLKVYGVTAAGTEVLLPATEYAVISSQNVSVATNKISGDSSKVDLDAATGHIPETKEASVKVVINQTGQELTATGTIAATLPKAAKIEVRQGGTKNGTLLTALNNLAVVGALDATEFSSPDTIYIEDQYGVAIDATNSTVRYTFTNLVNSNNSTANGTVPTVTGNGTTAAQVTGLESGDTLTVRFTIGEATTTVNVSVQ